MKYSQISKRSVLSGYSESTKDTLYLDGKRMLWKCKCGEINWASKRNICRTCYRKNPFLSRKVYLDNIAKGVW